jgi:hypothetical protein
VVDNGEKRGGGPAAESPDKERILKVRISGKCLGDLPRGSTVLLGNLDTVTLADCDDKIGTGGARTPACRPHEGNCCLPVHPRVELGRRTRWTRPKPSTEVILHFGLAR